MKKTLSKLISVVLSIVLSFLTMPELFVSLIATAAPVTADDGYEYALFPANTLCVTQGAFGEYNSYSHNGQTGYYQNAFDFGVAQNYYAPFTGTITTIKTSFNAVCLQSDNKVHWANGKFDYMSVVFVHDNDIDDLYVGKKIKQGEIFYQPGVKGGGTGAHVHLCVNIGQTNAGINIFSGDTRPNEAFFIPDSTTVTQTGIYDWQKLGNGIVPTPPTDCNCSASHAGQYKTTAVLNIRSGHGTSYGIVDSIPSGATVTVSKADGSWAHVSYNGVNGYSSMTYLTKVSTPTSGMTISGETVPPDQHTLGKNFPVKGIIKSNLPITEVWGGVYYWDWSKPVPKAYADVAPNATTYDLSSYAFDYGIIFDSVPEGFYHYLICATDSSGKKYELINKDFKVGNPPCTSHSFGNWSVITAATCTTDGSQKRSCSICGYSETGTIAKIGHSYTETKTDPTCTENGKIVATCGKCGDSKTTVLEKTGHKYSDWTTSNNATCIADGAQIRTCSVCGHIETKDISKSGHKYTETVIKSSCTEKGYTLYECSVCGDSYKDKYTEVINHSYKIETVNGTRKFKCSTCDSSFSIPFEGSGTESDPFKISSEKDLITLSDLINDYTSILFFDKYYIQTVNIDLKDIDWTPIGTFTKKEDKSDRYFFVGHYNGNYHTIINLNCDTNDDYAGLFGRLGENQSQYANKCEISNLSVYGNVKGKGYATGGIAGELCIGSTVKNCSFTGNVTGESNVGGIAGMTFNGGYIYNSYHNGNVTATDNYAGGVIGSLRVGNHIYVSVDAGVWNSCHTAGYVSAKNGVIGGITSRLEYGQYNVDSKITLDNNYYLSSACSGGINGDITTGCTKLSDKLLKSVDELMGSPFIHNEDSTLNNGYPIFEWQQTPYQFKGEGTVENPYEISSKKELETMRDLVNSNYFSSKYADKFYIQTADIDLENELWEPIGIRMKNKVDLSAPLFDGSYNGNNHIIKNLYVNRNDGNKFAGLFGSFCGSHTIENLVVYGSVYGNGGAVGGICGEIVNGGGKIKNCAFIGDVKGNFYVGGIAGVVYLNGSIENCYHIGNVSSINDTDDSIGGITGNITAGDYIPGNVKISNCYHVGKVSGTNNAIGGIVGETLYFTKVDSSVNITNCYYIKSDCLQGNTGDFTGENDITALTPSLLKQIAVDLGEPFITNTDASLLEGYPVFSWQLNTSSDIIGDLNNDNTVDLTDLTTISQYLLQDITFDDNQLKLADVNHDGIVDICDLAVFKQYVMNEISEF